MVTKSFSWLLGLYFFNNFSCSLWLKTFLSPKNLTYPPNGIAQNFHLVPDLSLKPKISLPKPIEKSVTPTPNNSDHIHEQKQQLLIELQRV